MHDTAQGYGLWTVVVLNSALFIFFAFSFFKPQTARDWRSFGAFSAFLVALFTEMYGFPLTIYLLLPWLQSRFPEVNWLTHDAGHLLEETVGWRGNPHFGPFHILSDIFIGGGFWLLSASWPPLYRAPLAPPATQRRVPPCSAPGLQPVAQAPCGLTWDFCVNPSGPPRSRPSQGLGWVV